MTAAVSDADRARRAGERAGDLLRSLMTEVDRLRARLKEYDRMQTFPAPEVEADPAYELWRALMEDLRDEGVLRMTMHHETALIIGYEPVRQETLSAVGNPSHNSGATA